MSSIETSLAALIDSMEMDYLESIINHDAETCQRCNGARAVAKLFGQDYPLSQLCMDGVAQLAFVGEPVPNPDEWKRRKPTPNRKTKA